MSLLRPFTACDLFRFNNVNLDTWTETYDIPFYLSYLSKWPDLFLVETDPVDAGKLMGYVMGKVEGTGRLWHGHVTCITVAPEYRFLGVAKRLMHLLESVSAKEDGYHAYFVDLFVRMTNKVAIDMYKGMGYSVFRRVVSYYHGGVRGGDEDAFDMRLPLERDVAKTSIRGGGENVRVRPEDCFF